MIEDEKVEFNKLMKQLEMTHDQQTHINRLIDYAKYPIEEMLRDFKQGKRDLVLKKLVKKLNKAEQLKTSTDASANIAGTSGVGFIEI